MSGTSTKTRIREEALRLFVEKGVAETSIRDLVGRVGVTEGTLYRHYAGKEDLVRELFQTHYAAFAERITQVQADEAGLRAKMRAIVRDACRLFDEDPTLYRFLLLVQHDALPRLPKDGPSARRVVQAMMKEAAGRGELAVDDPELASALFIGLVVQPALSMIHGALPPPLSRHADGIAAVCERALAR
jgi:AcrR family transcriptional regulator